MPSTVDALDERTLTGLLVGLVLLGLALIVADVRGSPLRNSTPETYVIFGLPIIIAVVAYVRFAATTRWWEAILLFGWALLAMLVTVFVGFLATMGSPGGDPGIVGELLRDVVLFLAGSIGLGVPYAVAGHLRGDRPRVAALVVLLSFIPLFVLSMIAATAV